MERRTLGRTGLEVSVLGFGGAPIGFLGTEESRVAALLNRLLDGGVNLIDTAAMYAGSEAAIARAIGHRRHEFVLVSKCGDGWDRPGDQDWSAAGIARYLDRSLTRLGTDAIDVMLLHSCDLETLHRGEALGALVAARDAGKVRFVGYSGDNAAAAHAATLPDVAVVEASINVADQANVEALLPLAVRHDVGVIVKRPLANAAWKPPADQRGHYVAYARTYHDRLAAMRPLLERRLGTPIADRDWPGLALRFALAQPGVTTAIVGTTDPEHVAANLEAAEAGTLPDAVLAAFREAFRAAEAQSGTAWAGQT
jgi:aryl-alcohol dehydrogenase-like predicted oxidoreductase